MIDLKPLQTKLFLKIQDPPFIIIFYLLPEIVLLWTSKAELE